jgi:hypothetical protein
MLYLDSLLFLIVIILLYILINKLIDKKKEGFEHKGDAQIVHKKKTTSIIQSAQYGSLRSLVISIQDKDTHWKGSTDVKPILDKMIKTETPNTIVSNISFGGVGESTEAQSSQSIEDNILIIKFSNTYTRPKDAGGELTNGAGETGGWLKGTWYWLNGETVDLTFGNVMPDPWWLKFAAVYYKIAELLAIILIQMPYRFVNEIAIMFIRFMLNLKEIIKPIMDLFTDLFSIVRDVYSQIFGWFKWLFFKWLSIIRDIPGFLRSNFKTFINFIKTAVTKTFKLFKVFFNIIKMIFNAIIKLPLQIFDLIEGLANVIINLILIIIGLPVTILNYIIAFQEIMLDLMEKNPKIPFIDMFFG